MLNEASEVKIGDFGLACAQSLSNEKSFIESNLNNNDESTHFDANSISTEHTKGVGTSLYSSPEQLKDKTYDCKVSFQNELAKNLFFYFIYLDRSIQSRHNSI